MKRTCLLIILIATFATTMAQKNGSVKGFAFDTLANNAIVAATITLMEKKDSSLVSFTMTDHTGRFELKGIPNGEYRLMISHVNYHNSNTFFSITDENKTRDFGNVNLLDVSRVLQEVVVTNEAPPVTLVGDTVQYNAGSFRTIPNASVEQLLKKLPGVKVDKDGKITAQGEKVSRVLVDGKEFFGNDPKIATRNLPADAIDKVQVYDKQSDQAQLTGFEDGNYEKTINLTLKKDKKKGVFGKVAAAAGDQERYETKFNLSSFKGARQMSAIGMGNNTNAEGFSFMDILNFTGALNQMKQGGNVNISLNQDDAEALGMNANNNSGINTAWGGGINYNNIIGSKLDLQSNYFYNRYNPHVESRIFRQNFLPGTTNFYDQYSNTDNLNNSHRLNLNLLYQIDSFHSLRINPSFSLQKTNKKSQSSYSTRMPNGQFINEGFSNSLSGNEGYNFKNDLVFRKKFQRRGRTLSLSLTTSLNETDGDGDLSSIINYYSGASILKKDTINQRNTNSGDLRGYNARVIYTEPLWKRTLLEFSAGRSNTLNTAEKLTYDYNHVNGKYDQLNSFLSNDFENLYSYTTAGFRMRKQGKKYNYSLGVTWQKANLEGKIISGIKDSIITKEFRNLLPVASFKYNFSRYKNVSLNYGASTNQPTLSQLQPVPDNSNPLYIRLGNPDLKQEFTHTMRANLHLVSPYKNRNLFLFLTANTTRNKIVNYDSVNIATGIRSTRPVNVNGVYNLTANIDYSMPLRFLKASLNVGTTVGYTKGKQFLNTFENTTRNLSVGPNFRMDFTPTEKLSLNAGADFRINRTTYSLQRTFANNYLSQEYSSGIDWQLPKNFFLSTEFTYTIISQRSAGFNTDIPIWNASISKQFLKYNRGEIKLSVSDILNRNIGITRNSNQNYIEDRQVNTLKRFFLLGFTYSLSKTGLGAGGSGGTMILR